LSIKDDNKKNHHDVSIGGDHVGIPGVALLKFLFGTFVVVDKR
jgi:hypothetical protein